MKTVATWSPTDFVIFRPRHEGCTATVRMHWTEVMAEMRERGMFADYSERDLREFGKNILLQHKLQHRCPEHGKWMSGEFVLGKDSGKVQVCNGKCMGAVGPQCDCPCRGQNHGSSHGGA